MISFNPSLDRLKLKEENNKTVVWDIVRKKWIVLTPEEFVRQSILQYLTINMQYPLSLIAVEKKIVYGTLEKRFDIVVYARTHEPWLLIECKEPSVAVDEKALHQLLNYHHSVPCPYWLLTNGHQSFCADANDLQNIKWLDALPAYDF